ncbi:hypothetical protein E2562_016858 [Oryza meyeriana var. granulata]|uniref:Uncharacterized protein n=1 Tax=Oryza meyeriana var. granulata TaxID=110450 RepID=A0A6G1BXR4_9ORYZ|nr:hypothetical protein E2562_016858 [Oryza meyeriana var. granulata]
MRPQRRRTPTTTHCKTAAAATRVAHAANRRHARDLAAVTRARAVATCRNLAIDRLLEMVTSVVSVVTEPGRHARTRGAAQHAVTGGVASIST